MTTANSPVPQAGQTGNPEEFYVFPEPPKTPEDRMTSFDQLTITGAAHYLADHLARYGGNPETTLVAGDRYLALAPTRNLAGVRYPDLLVAFGVDPAIYKARNAYVISDQGKPPDLVMEVASPSTGRVDVREKRVDYAALGIPEYWRFDETGEHHGTRLAGDSLVDGVYVPIPIEQLDDDLFQGYSEVLQLSLRWVSGLLHWYFPPEERYVATLEGERARADREQARAEAAEARIRELEDRLRQR